MFTYIFIFGAVFILRHKLQLKLQLASVMVKSACVCVWACHLHLVNLQDPRRNNGANGIEISVIILSLTAAAPTSVSV